MAKVTSIKSAGIKNARYQKEGTPNLKGQCSIVQ